MTKLFNFEDETLNNGFQIDMSVLTPEQGEHVLQIFEARGSIKCNDEDDGDIVMYDLDENSFAFYDTPSAHISFIDYPTLCRAAVQLEPNKVNTLLDTIEQVRKQVIDLEQKNYELESDNLKARDYIGGLTELLGKSQMIIAELEAQLAAKSEVLSNTEQLPVYDANWISNVVSKYNHDYGISIDGLRIGLFTFGGSNYLSQKDSAPILMAALAKELNGDWVGKGNYWLLHYDLVHEEYMSSEYGATYEFGQPKFKTKQSAQKAIDILTTHFPEVLKNYFA